jgi:DNA-binding MarR family transcriptional regulator
MASKKIDVQLLDHLWRLSTASNRHVEAIFQDLIDCSLPKFLVLRTLATMPPMQGALAATDIAKALGCSKANAGQLVTRLEEEGRIKKLSGGADGRVVGLRITAKGEQHYERCEEQLGAEAKRLLAGLDADEKRQLLALLEKVTFPSNPS